MERVRGGIRKIIGNPGVKDESKIDIPEIDFGITQRLTPESSRPGTAAGRKSPFESLSRPSTANGRRSPFDNLGQPSGQRSPYDALTPESMNPTPEKSLPSSPTEHRRRPSPTEQRPRPPRPQSYLWQPGTMPEKQSMKGLSAEEFVQQRTALASKPQGYVPHRTGSSGRIEQIRTEQPSPQSPRSLSRRMSAHRHSSASSLDYSSYLSAREQEHVAKITGAPLLSLNPQPRTPDPSVGLIGAIEAREQERRDIREGLQGKMVQAAIDQRQREARMYQSPQNSYPPQNSYAQYAGNPYGQHGQGQPGGQYVQQPYLAPTGYQQQGLSYLQYASTQAPAQAPQASIPPHQYHQRHPSTAYSQHQHQRQGSGYYATQPRSTSSRWA